MTPSAQFIPDVIAVCTGTEQIHSCSTLAPYPSFIPEQRFPLSSAPGSVEQIHTTCGFITPFPEFALWGGLLASAGL